MVVAMAIIAAIFFFFIDQILKFLLDIILKVSFNEKLVYSSISFKF